MTNALYEINDIDTATFFHKNLDENRDALSSVLDYNHNQTTKDTDFMLPLRLLQSLYGYQMR